MILYKDYLSNQEHYELIDIRAEETIEETGMIEHARPIFKELLFSEPERYLSKDLHYVVYCGSGNSAGRLEHALTEAGYHVESLKGGFKGYQAE